MQIINIGKNNSTFQQILALKENRTKRSKMGLFFVEGVQNIKDAISNNWKIEAFILCKNKKLSTWADEVKNKANVNYILDENLFNELSDKEDKSKILALIKMKTFNEIVKEKNPIYVLLDKPSKKGNLGSIIRSCDALSVTQIFYSGHSVDIFDHQVISASMGSFFKLPITFISSNEHFINIKNELNSSYKNFKVVATSLQTENLVQNYNFKNPVLILVGNETAGLNKFYNEQADDFVKIDMRDGIDSLNVACATTAVLYEINRQRR